MSGYVTLIPIFNAMIKVIIPIVLFSFLLLACNDQQQHVKALQSQIDSLELKIEKSYKPGFGEFMSSIQVHHEKLWFAGINKNWKLADFEIGEIKESLDDIQTYCTDRPERQSLSMINQPMDSITNAIQQKSDVLFKSSFITLTSTCNNCHKATAHEFNVIKVPDTPPFSNQVFAPGEEKK